LLLLLLLLGAAGRIVGRVAGRTGSGARVTHWLRRRGSGRLQTLLRRRGRRRERGGRVAAQWKLVVERRKLRRDPSWLLLLELLLAAGTGISTSGRSLLSQIWLLLL
jgi:hypothetical protein